LSAIVVLPAVQFLAHAVFDVVVDDEIQLLVGEAVVVSAYDLLVTWQRIQSSRPAETSTTAGRSLEEDKSENGNLEVDPIVWTKMGLS